MAAIEFPRKPLREVWQIEATDVPLNEFRKCGIALGDHAVCVHPTLNIFRLTDVVSHPVNAGPDIYIDARRHFEIRADRPLNDPVCSECFPGSMSKSNGLSSCKIERNTNHDPIRTFEESVNLLSQDILGLADLEIDRLPVDPLVCVVCATKNDGKKLYRIVPIIPDVLNVLCGSISFADREVMGNIHYKFTFDVGLYARALTLLWEALCDVTMSPKDYHTLIPRAMEEYYLHSRLLRRWASETDTKINFRTNELPDR